MSRARDLAFDTMATMFGLLLAGAFFLAVFQGWTMLPRILGVTIPSVLVTDAHPYSRDKDRACFQVALHKIARGLPLKPIFHVETPASPELGVSVYRIDPASGQRLPDKLPEHPIGVSWVSRYCFDFPGTVTPADDLTVSGSLLHQRWFGRVVEPIPTFKIAPMG